MAVTARSIREAAGRLRSGGLTASELASATLDAVDRLDGRLRSFVLVDREGAQVSAEAADARLEEGRAGPLTGVPVGVKDIVDMAGLPTRCGSPAYPDRPRSSDAPAAARLREAGAVIVGKTTSHELACGVSSPPAVNPWDTSRIPGGSSGGSGAAVAAGLVPMAIGSDTGGSIRIPAALCGVTGLKPTYGLVPTDGVEPLSWSLDHLGPLAASVEDCALSLEVLAGGGDYTAGLEGGVRKMRIGVLAGPPFSPMAPDVEAAFREAVQTLRGLGAAPVELDIPELEYTLPAEFAIVGPEAAARHRLLLRRRPELIDPDIRQVLTAGALMPTSHYLKGLQARRVIRDAIRREMTERRLDVLASPTLPAAAARLEQQEFEFGGQAESVTLAYVRTTAPFNLSGQPALSVPCGFDRRGLPIGLQLAGRPFDESTVLRAGAAYEAASDWQGRPPPVHVSTLAG